MAEPAATAMMPATKITCEVAQGLAGAAEAALAAQGVDTALLHSRRCVVLHERAVLPFLPPTTGLDEDPAAVFEVYVPRDRARGALLAWARALQLFGPGRGTVYAEDVEILDPDGLDFGNTRLPAADDTLQRGERLPPLSLINCVVQRGRGNAIARCALEIGGSVPSVNFGVGTGVRDRLGLLRVAIPADKEIVSLVVDAQEQQAFLDALIDAGRLDQPGRGFIAAYPVAFGVPNRRAFRGPQHHSATMDQVIAAIDHLAAGTDWRRRPGTPDASPPSARRGLLGLVNLTLSCSEGSAEPVLATAMRSGAGGATTSRVRRIAPGGKVAGGIPGRESIDLGLPANRVAGMIQALRDSGAFGTEVACFVEAKPLAVAFTYMAA